MNELNLRKQQRQQTLLRLVNEKRLSTQQDVVRALRSAGYAATQATVSRDIVELGLVKVGRDGAHVYAAPAALPASGGIDRLRRFCEEYPVSGAVAGNLVVLRTPPGTANAFAIALDTSGFSDVVGTIAGDDTVFVAARDPARARVINRRLAEFGIGKAIVSDPNMGVGKRA
ncbi:MAG TPA: arginine repressor [Candidatus Limnocylindria bacterium]|jgi:transcriptional regulator of arginine metabolism